jgi:hypothetical protein
LPHARAGQKNTGSGSELMKGNIHAIPTCIRPAVLIPTQTLAVYPKGSPEDGSHACMAQSSPQPPRHKTSMSDTGAMTHPIRLRRAGL